MMGVVLRHPAHGHAMSTSKDAVCSDAGSDPWGAWMARAQGGDKQGPTGGLFSTHTG